VTATFIWIGSSFLTVIFGLIGIVYFNLTDRINKIEIRIDKLEEKKDFNGMSPYVLNTKISTCEKFITELREMKHLKVDPYLPKAFDDLHNRVISLEKRRRVE
jgi:hypothetical protein